MLTCLTSNHFIQNGMEMNQMMSNTISILLLPGGGELRYSIYIGIPIYLIIIQKGFASKFY